jgi:cytochrome d ubiquinol oxidase subunit II
MKLSGRIQLHMRSLAWPFALATIACMGAVSLWTPFLDPVYFERWFTWPSAGFSAVVPVLLALCVLGLFTGLRQGRDIMPFLCALSLFVLGFIGIGISFYPYMVPPGLTIVDAAAPDSSLAFALVGTVVLLPMILMYTAYAYWVFRGKVDPEEGYH